MALGLRWLLHEWASPGKKLGSDPNYHATNKTDFFFIACTTIALGTKKEHSGPRAGSRGRRPKDVAPLLQAKMKKKKRTMVEALRNNTWIRDLDYRTSFTTAHLSQFITLWQLVIAAELQQEQEDQITWTQTTHGEYTTASAYKARFSSCVSNPHIAIICKTWAPPKCKFFAWLIVQNKVWTSDLLDHREWDHNPSRHLCRATMETAHHLFASCRYTRWVWGLVAQWTGLTDLKPTEWRHSATTLQWWRNITTTPDIPRKAVCTVALLVMWKICKE
jgi:hypothetical protein